MAQEENCRLAEVLQYMCSLERHKITGGQQLFCTQVPRIFKLCPGKPAVEVTRVTDINLVTGEVEVSEALVSGVRGKDWNSIIKYPIPDQESA